MASVASATANSQQPPQGETLRSFETQVTRALVAHEQAVLELRQSVEVDVVLWDAKLKQELQDVYATNPGGDKRVPAFKLVVARLVNDNANGAAALAEIDNESLGKSIVRFKPKH